jgi:hypothetical protein
MDFFSQACLERGLHFDLKAEEAVCTKEMQKLLDWWLHISTQHKGEGHTKGGHFYTQNHRTY